MVGDVAEVTTLLTHIVNNNNTYSEQKEIKWIEKTLDPYHVDHIQISALDNVI